MRKLFLASACLFLAFGAANATPCEEVVASIAEKIKANGVVAFTLEIIDKGAETDKKVVGTCGEGTKDIVYQRGNAAVSESSKDVADKESSEIANNANF
ncbi:MAG: DUF1161 domain-containing protein [Campylobacteraceae bacterium]|jgi:hypothetical protein|nr:DUF1161 domain-containing protein [Campylobacteraceae bacterium]